MNEINPKYENTRKIQDSDIMWFDLFDFWCLTPLSTLVVEEAGVLGENHRP